MTNINELSNEDIIISYNGNIFAIDLNDTSINNISYVKSIIKYICSILKEYKPIFFYNDKIKDDLLEDDGYELFNLLYTFDNVHKLLFCSVGEYNNVKSIYIDNDNSTNILHSNDFKNILDYISPNVYKWIIINGKPYKVSKLLNINENLLYEENNKLSLTSFKTKSELHSKIWIDNKINSRVRLKLLDIADDFINDLSMDWVKPKDIVFTGSLANYNWSRYSDIDIHIIYDFSKIYKNKDFVDDYFKSKKENWKQQHDTLKIYGFPVEISIEDSNEESVSSGVYSLNKNKWIVEPTNFDDVKLNEKYIKDKASNIMKEIDNIENSLSKEDDSHKVEVLGNKLKRIFNRIKKSRKEALERSGEMSSMNIVYKLLRRTKYIDKLWDMVNNTYNKINSIK